jgi:hypothetical protein
MSTESTTSCCPNFCSNVGNVIHKGFEGFISSIVWLDRTITSYCDQNLPQPFNVIAKAAIKALPFIILHSLVPPLVNIGTLIVISLISDAANGTEKRLQAMPNIINSLSLNLLYNAGFTLFHIATTHDPVAILWGISNTITGIFLAFKSGLIPEIVSSIKQRCSSLI